MKSKTTEKFEVAGILFKIGAVIFRTRQPFRYTSGILSPVYTDNRLIISYPLERERIVDLLIEKIRQIGLPDVIAGTATAGIPHAAFIAQKLNLPMIYVRSEKKSYGKGNQIEGIVKRGQKAIVIEDLISTGNSSLAVTKALKHVGVKVNDLLAIFSYGFKDTEKNFKKNKINLHVLTDLQAATDVARGGGYLKEEQVKAILEWSKDAKGWGKKMGFE